jgi:hypothetical protein
MNKEFYLGHILMIDQLNDERKKFDNDKIEFENEMKIRREQFE